MERRSYESGAISPDDVEMLGSFFDQILDEYQIPREGEEAEELAARLISIYQTGVRDVAMLKHLAIRPQG